MCAPIEGRSGPVGAHPRRGHCSKRWLAQCGVTDSLYTIACCCVFADEPGTGGARGILGQLGFPEPCGHPGFQPSPKHTVEGCVLPSDSNAAVPASTAL